MKVKRKVLLETAGEGYPFFRIPGIVATQSGALLVYYECRQGGDWSVIDICMKKSTDHGESWSERQLLVSGGGKNTVNNPVMFVDGPKLHFVWMENYKRAFYQCSLDDGDTWSQALEITDAFEQIRQEHPWTVIAVGPGHGTVTSSGRLLVPVWIANDPTSITAHAPSCCATLYSDDSGASWHLGALVPTGESVISPNEAALAELPDGRILLNMRSKSEQLLRCVAISSTGIGQWNDIYFHPRLPDPQCEGALCTCPGGILFTNCHSQSGRFNLSLQRSADLGATWELCAIEPVAAYSDVTYHVGTQMAFVVYEKGDYACLQVAEMEL